MVIEDIEKLAGRERRWPRLSAGGWPLSARSALVLLAGMAGVSIALRIALAREVPAPFFFMDELGYEQMAKSLARSGDLALFGKSGSSYGPLYSLILAPIYALTRSAPQAYAWAKIVNAVLMSLSAFPVYRIARFVLSRPRALGVAALSLIAPLMFYSALELSENLAYPLFLVAVWTMLQALREPRLRNDAVLLGAIGLASAARLQNVALLPAAVTAIVAVPLVRPEVTRLRALRRSLAEHRLLVGVTGAGLIAALARTLANGGALPLAGRYSNVGSAHASPLHVLEVAAQHLAAFDFAVGIIPFAAALVAGYALARTGFPMQALTFGAVATAVTIWLFLEVAFDAAAFDRPYVQHVGEQFPPDASRFHERYLIYLVPFFLVALIAVLRMARPKVGARVHLAAAAAAALLPAAIPFAHVVNDTSVAESFGLQVLAKNVAGTILPYGHALQIAVILGVVLAAAYLYALLRPHPSFAVVVTIFVFLIFSSVARVRIIGASQTIALPSSQARWVDREVGSAPVVLVAGPGAQRATIVETAFENLSISSLYYVCKPAFDPSFGEQRLALDTGDGLLGAGGPLRAQYVVAPTDFDVAGRLLAVSPKGELALVAPTGGVLRLAPVGEPAARCEI
jgi:dolichyl-phosphate-mannose-protein mannosyltransferase